MYILIKIYTLYTGKLFPSKISSFISSNSHKLIRELHS